MWRSLYGKRRMLHHQEERSQFQPSRASRSLLLSFPLCTAAFWLVGSVGGIFSLKLILRCPDVLARFPPPVACSSGDNNVDLIDRPDLECWAPSSRGVMKDGESCAVPLPPPGSNEYSNGRAIP